MDKQSGSVILAGPEPSQFLGNAHDRIAAPGGSPPTVSRRSVQSWIARAALGSLVVFATSEGLLSRAFPGSYMEQTANKVNLRGLSIRHQIICLCKRHTPDVRIPEVLAACKNRRICWGFVGCFGQRLRNRRGIPNPSVFRSDKINAACYLSATQVACRRKTRPYHYRIP